jgi:hypothetical protein
MLTKLLENLLHGHRIHFSVHACQHTSAYVSIRQHTSVSETSSCLSAYASIRQHTSAYVSIRNKFMPVSIRQHTPAYVSIRQRSCLQCGESRLSLHTPAYVSIRQHTSAYVSVHACNVVSHASVCQRSDTKVHAVAPSVC